MLTAIALGIAFAAVAALALIVWAIHSAEPSLGNPPGALVFVAIVALAASLIASGVAAKDASKLKTPPAFQVRICPVTAETP